MSDIVYSNKVRHCANCNTCILNGDPFVILKEYYYFKCTTCDKVIYEIFLHPHICNKHNIAEYTNVLYFCAKDCHSSYNYNITKNKKLY
jgi:hypothetical protein